MKTLVVDDDEISSLLLVDSLTELGFQVSTAPDGEEGWERFCSDEYPIVILDWVMPRLDGIGLCQRIRERSAHKYTYVILLTGRTEREDRLKALESGADDFLGKPLDVGELKARLGVARRILESEEQVREVRLREMALGSSIQSKLLFGAAPADVEGIAIDSISLPSKAVAGDFLDFYPYANGILDILVGDVMGKGVPAAMIAAGIKSAIEKSLLSRLSKGVGLPGVEEVLTLAGRRVIPELIDLNSYATLCYARFYGAQRRLAYVNCGHPNLIRWNALLDTCEMLPNSTVPMGFVEADRFPEREVRLEAGDLVCLYSDGVSDLLGGPEGLAGWLAARASLPLKETISELPLSSQELKDDSTFVLVRVKGSANGRAMQLWSEYGALTRARQLIGELGLHPDDAGELALAVQEAGSNALRHARPEHRHLPLALTVSEAKESVRVELRYPGRPFNPGTIREVDADLGTEGGLGLSIIARSVDEYSYYREGPWNVVALTKRKRKSEG